MIGWNDATTSCIIFRLLGVNNFQGIKEFSDKKIFFVQNIVSGKQEICQLKNTFFSECFMFNVHFFWLLSRERKEGFRSLGRAEAKVRNEFVVESMEFLCMYFKKYYIYI